MYLHITTGTVSYMKDLLENHSGLLMNAIGQDAILYYEDDKENSIFNSPRTYLTLNSKGMLDDNYPAVVSTIPVANSNRAATSAHLKDLHVALENQNGLLAYRIGETVNDSAFTVITVWASREAYTDFKDTDTYKEYLSSEVLHKFRNEESLFQDYISSKMYLPLKENIEEEYEEDY